MSETQESRDAAVTTREWHLAGAAGHLYARAWIHPSREPDHLVVLVHGYGEHIGRYDHVAANLVAAGAVVYGLDHQGHGRSAGPRVDIADLAPVVTDVHRLVAQARTAYRHLPLVVLGHSVGGLIATRYAQQYAGDMAGLVLSGPVLGRWSALQALLEHPELRDAPLDPAALSRDPEVATSYANDELVWHGGFQERTLRALQTELARVAAAGNLETLPTLWLHGAADSIVPVQETIVGIGNLLGSEGFDLAARIYPDARHEIFNEVNRTEVLAEVRAFIARVRGV